MKKIPLTQGKFALVDDEDFERVSQFKWHANRRIYKKNNTQYTFYASTIIYKNNKRLYLRMHQFIMGVQNGYEADHKDGNGLNNQKSNLRRATHSQNLANQKKSRGKSKYKGVHQCERGRWRACITYNNKNIKLGRFDTEIEAARAYNIKAEELFGEFACINILCVK